MNGIKPAFLDGVTLTQAYYDPPNPYADAPSTGYNLLELSRYAKRHNKKLIELTKEEIQPYAI